MQQTQIRKLILQALYQDEWFYNQLVLKGGNALSMIYKIGQRTSLDLDFSISNDFHDNQEEIGKRIRLALKKIFDKHDILVFDFSFDSKPKKTKDNWWGGYRAEFKLISKSKAENLNNDIEHLRRNAFLIGEDTQRKKYSIEISKFEYIKDSQVIQYEGFNILVYSPVLLAVEKLRALLQQHHDYSLIPVETKRSRGRDFYDIWVICNYFSIKLSAQLELVEIVFNTKRV